MCAIRSPSVSGTRSTPCSGYVTVASTAAGSAPAPHSHATQATNGSAAPASASRTPRQRAPRNAAPTATSG